MEMESANTNGFFTCLVILILIALTIAPVVIGVQSRSVWPGLLAFLSIVMAWIAVFVYADNDNWMGYLLLSALSLMFLSLGAVLSRLAGGWWWTLIWLAVASAHYLVATAAQEEGELIHMFVASALGLLSVAAAFLLPWKVKPLLQEAKWSLPTLWWPWLMLVAGTAATGIAWYWGYRESEERAYLRWGIAGVALMAGATWLLWGKGGWWWSLPWLFAALALGHAGWDLRRHSFSRTVGTLGMALAVLCLFAALGVPLLSSGAFAARVLSLALPISARWNPRSGLHALGEFLIAAIRSGWGIFHFFTLFALGYFWLRRGWTGLVAPLLLFFIVWLAGAGGFTVQNAFVRTISSSPVVWAEETLRSSAQRWGTMAWGILLFGFLVSVLIFPVLRFSDKIHRILALITGSNLGATTFERLWLMMRQMKPWPVGALLALYTVATVVHGSWISLWIALRRIASSADTPLGFAWIPDLTVPHWKPVWDVRYFSLGLLVWLLSLALVRLQEKYDLVPPVAVGCLSGWMLFLGALLAVSLVPAGVMLFALAQLAFQISLIPVRVAGIRKIPPPRPTPPPSPPPTPAPTPPPPPSPSSPPPIFIPTSQPPPLSSSPPPIFIPTPHPPSSPSSPPPILTPAPHPPSPSPPPPVPEKRLAGYHVWSAPAPLVDVTDWRGAIWYLRRDGDLVRQRGSETQKFSLPISRGGALFAPREDDPHLLVVGEGKKVLWIDGESLQITRTVTLSRLAEALVLNPFRTILAWLSVSEGAAGLLLLASGQEVTLCSGLNLAPALAFSANGRYLALGGADGTIHIMDIATRRPAGTISLPETSPSRGKALRFLAGRSDGGWVGVYADRRIVLWDANLQIVQETRPARRILALDYHPKTERLALGLSDGILQVLDAELKRVFSGTVQEQAITLVRFSQDGNEVFTFGDGKEVRKIVL